MTPWELAATSEHSQQRAVFAWANCAAQFGFYAAQYGDCYSLAKRERHFKLGYGLGPAPVPVPELSLLFAIHNQGHGDAIRGAHAKAEGVKAGVPDMFLPVPRRFMQQGLPISIAGLFIELKKIKKGVVSEDQYFWQTELMAQGYASHVCKGWIEAANLISEYLGSSIRISNDPI